MKRLTVFSIIFLLAVLSVNSASFASVKYNHTSTLSAVATPQVTYTFTLVNKTGYDIKELYFAPSSSGEWDTDDELLKGQLFKNGEAAKITYTAKKNADKWDLMCAWTDGSANSHWNAIDLNGATKLTMTYERSSDTTYIERE
jgi:hypothetical protein